MKVTQVVGDGGVVEVYFDGPSADSPFVRALLPVSDTSPSQGDQVQAEFWQLKVTKLDGMVTADNPASDPEPGTLLVIGLILLPLGAGASAWGIVAARRLGRGLDAQANPGPGMGPLAGSDVLWR